MHKASDNRHGCKHPKWTEKAILLQDIRERRRKYAI